MGHVKPKQTTQAHPDNKKNQDPLQKEALAVVDSLFVCSILDPGCHYQKIVTEDQVPTSFYLRKGIATLVTLATIIQNARLREGKQTLNEKQPEIHESRTARYYYPLPSIDCKVEAVMGFKYKCFLDAYKGYHQIQMAREDEEKTAFYTEQGTYCYMKMPFGLKNAGATYQRLVDSTFQSQIGREPRSIWKTWLSKQYKNKDLLVDLAEHSKNLKAINMKLNPKKCSFGVEEGKFFGIHGHIGKSQGKPQKDKGHNGSPPSSPKTLKEMQSLSGKLASLNRFLAKSAERALSFFNTLKNITKENKHEYRWTPEAKRSISADEEADKSFPINTTPPFPKETLYAYLAVAKRLSSSITATETKREDNAQSRMLKRPKSWQIFMSDLRMRAEEEYFRMPEVPPEVDTLKSGHSSTDGAASLKSQSGSRANRTIGVRLARKMKVSGIEVKVDSKLVANQINGTYEATKESMIKYWAKAKEFISEFKTFSIENIPREDNQKADILSKLATVPFSHLTKEILVEVLNERSTDAKEVQTIVEEEGENWMTPIINYLEEGIVPSDKNEARSLRSKISQYVLESGVLFKKGYLVPMLRCVGPLQANYVIREIHMGSCGMHIGPRAVVRKAMRQGYYWPTMHADAKKEVDKCDSCQIHSPIPRLPKTHMTSIMAPWPFYQWGMDILGPLTPARGGAKFVIVAIDYFTKWIEAKPLIKITGKEVIRFVIDLHQIAVRPPREIVTNNGAQLGINRRKQRLNLIVAERKRKQPAVPVAKYKTKRNNTITRGSRPAGIRPVEFVYRRNEEAG
ncbi:reverse transcriptase domain-containing protein [Tanacetum coccineum]